MAISNPKDVFLYELSLMHDAEQKVGSWLGEIAGQIRNKDLKQLVSTEQQECQQKIKNIESCLQAIGGRPQDVPSLAIDGIRQQFQHFTSRQPTPEALEMYTVGALLRVSNFGITTYKTLVVKAMNMGQTQCAQALQTNVVSGQECASKLERVTHQMSQRVMATA